MPLSYFKALDSCSKQRRLLRYLRFNHIDGTVKGDVNTEKKRNAKKKLNKKEACFWVFSVPILCMQCLLFSLTPIVTK